jgi:isoquinoline 1-oxidoreductase beta subunit
MNRVVPISRREFIKLTTQAGAGLVLAFSLPFRKLPGLEAASRTVTFQPNVWLSIDLDGVVTITMHRCEMGQNIWTALPAIVAKEMRADWSKVRIVQGDYDPKYGPQNTGGSASVRTSWEKLRRAGAVAREMLRSAAARQWGVAPEKCRVWNGRVSCGPGRSLDFGALAEAAAQMPLPSEVTLEDRWPSSLTRLKLPDKNARPKTTGQLKYGLDFTLPGMLTAVVARCPVFGGKVAAYDDSMTRKIPGVKRVVPISAGLAVVAENTWAALKGRAALQVTWDEGPDRDLDSTAISAMLKELVKQPGQSIREEGDVAAILARAERQITAEYELPYLDHAPMEPMNCTAQVRSGRCEIWAPTQTPESAHRVAREITGLPAEAVTVHILFMGGGFGRRLRTDFVRDAVEVAQVLNGPPVKVIRTREEDLAHGFYRPATVHRLQGAVDREDRIIAWRHRLAGPDTDWHGMLTGGAGEIAYDVPNLQVEYATAKIPVPTGAWRSVAHTHNGFVIESFIDELAHLAGVDPLEFRRRHLRPPTRLKGVLDLAAEMSDWGNPPAGRSQGLAAYASFRSYAAVVAEVSVSPAGRLSVHRMVCALDCGVVVDSDGVRAQMEGGVVMALTAALYGKITIQDGRVVQRNFHDYPLLTMREMPKIETHLVVSDEPPTGVGEPPVPPTAPALTNAIFAATGKRIRRLPLAGQDLRPE